MNKKTILSASLAPVTGCTEPAACALAVAAAHKAYSNSIPVWLEKKQKTKPHTQPLPQPDKITVEVDKNTYKNGFDVAIPGTGGKKGLKLAAALGTLCSADNALNLFKNVDENSLQKAQKLLRKGCIEIKVKNNTKKSDLCIKASLHFKDSPTCKCTIKGEHANITMLSRGTKILFKESKKILKSHSNQSQATIRPTLMKMGLVQIISAAKSISKEDRALLRKAIKLNTTAAEIGLKKPVGMGVGYHMQKTSLQDGFEADLFMEIKAKTAAAADVRMSGEPVEIMSSSGSGNQGIMATIPILVVHQRLKKHGQKKLEEALALSHIFTAWASQRIGTLSPLCGCIVKAGLGATAGIAYYLSGCPIAIEGAVQNMAGNLTGEICDGAKTGCAMKLATAASAALQSALLSRNGVVIPSTSGIIGRRIEKTVQNIAELAKAMIKADSEIVKILDQKQTCAL